MDGPAAQRNSGSEEFLDAEEGKAHTGTHDVNDRIYCSYFVEVDLFQSGAMHPGFGFAESLKYEERRLLDARIERTRLNQTVDLLKVTTSVPLSMVVFVRSVLGGVRSVSCCADHMEICRFEALPLDNFGLELELIRDSKPGEFRAQVIQRHSQVKQSTHDHVTTGTVERLKIEDFSHG